MECCSQTIFLLWPKIAAVGEILWSPAPQPNDDDDDDDDDDVINERIYIRQSFFNLAMQLILVAKAT